MGGGGICRLCDEAAEYQTASVCVPPAMIRESVRQYRTHGNHSAVVGFPLGYSVTAAKVCEVKRHWRTARIEIDMVINLTDVRKERRVSEG